MALYIAEDVVALLMAGFVISLGWYCCKDMHFTHIPALGDSRHPWHQAKHMHHPW